MSTFSQFQGNREYPAGDAPFRAAEVAGPQPVFRNELDAMRSMWRRTPDGDYPDGYLGTVQTRRHERIRTESLRQAKPYSRGVHKGEKIDQSDYFWSDDFNLMSGLINEDVTGMRYVAPGIVMEAGYPQRQRATFPPAGDEPAVSLRRNAPRWSPSAGPSMGMAIPYPGR